MRSLILPALTLALSAQTPELVQAPIQRVRVHPDEAWVTRTAHLRLNTVGVHKLKFAQLPGGLTLDDLRIQAKGPEGTQLGEILVGPDRHVVPETAESKALLSKLEALHARKNALANLQQASERAMASLDQFQTNLRAEGNRPLPSPGQIVDLNRGLESRVAELLSSSQARTEELERLEKEMKELESRWQQLRGELDTNPNPSQVTVELTLPQAGATDLELSYRTRQARWKPAYEARLAKDGRALELVLFASVSQASGEAWEDVQIELSSSQPSQIQEIPRFAALPKLSWKAPVPMPTATAVVEVRASGLSLDNTSSSTALNLAMASIPKARPGYQLPSPKPVPALEPGAPLMEEAKGLARTWLLEGAKAVPSDGDAHRFRVLEEQMAPTLQVVVAPRLNPTPIQVVRFEAPTRLPLFPGAPISRSIGSLRLGQGVLQIPPAGQPFELSFGPFEGLRASLQRLSERAPFRMTKLTTQQRLEGGVVRQTTKEEVIAHEAALTWELRERVDLANDTPGDMIVEVLDRDLQTQHESVSIERTANSTPPTREAAPGVHAWQVAIPAKGQAHVDLGWSIRAPKEGEVLGLKELGFN